MFFILFIYRRENPTKPAPATISESYALLKYILSTEVNT